MTRTDVMASSRPRTPDGASIASRPSSRARWLLAPTLALLLALALALPGAAVAAGGTSGYEQEPNHPKTTPTTGTSPSKESHEPMSTSTTSTEPTSTSAKATALPFTGFDLRWDVGFGVLLLGAGISILAMQRRQRRRSQR
jgi:hypothetical protein